MSAIPTHYHNLQVGDEIQVLPGSGWASHDHGMVLRVSAVDATMWSTQLTYFSNSPSIIYGDDFSRPFRLSRRPGFKDVGGKLSLAYQAGDLIAINSDAKTRHSPAFGWVPEMDYLLTEHWLRVVNVWADWLTVEGKTVSAAPWSLPADWINHIASEAFNRSPVKVSSIPGPVSALIPGADQPLDYDQYMGRGWTKEEVRSRVIGDATTKGESWVRRNVREWPTDHDLKTVEQGNNLRFFWVPKT